MTDGKPVPRALATGSGQDAVAGSADSAVGGDWALPDAGDVLLGQVPAARDPQREAEPVAANAVPE